MRTLGLFIKYLCICAILVGILFSTQLVFFYGLDRFTRQMLISPIMAATVFAVFLTRMAQLKERLKEARDGLEAEVERRTRQLNDELKEKEVLLREVHHRVKNNMAIISSFLELQSITLGDSHVSQILRESRQRIKVMALVHEKLYSSDELSDINVGQYLRELVGGIASSHTGKDKVNLKYDIGQVSLNIDTLIPLGLLVNEAVVNAFKHAFASVEAPELRVSFNHGNDGVAVLEIADNGVGFSSDALHQGVKSLGMKIINALVRQLGGRLEISSTDGTCLRVEFPLEKTAA